MSAIVGATRFSTYETDTDSLPVKANEYTIDIWRMTSGISQVHDVEHFEKLKPTSSSPPVKWLAAVVYRHGSKIFQLDVSQEVVLADNLTTIYT